MVTVPRFRMVVLVFLWLCVLTAIASPAQSFRTLVNFDGTHGANPYATLVQGLDGNFYGITEFGGPISAGTVFKITPSGTLTTLYTFPNFSDGCNPVGGLVLGTDGNFYGSTATCGASSSGCAFGCGTTFKITPAGAFTLLHTFAATDGYQPEASMILGANGNFYGTTELGGTLGYGTVFEMTRSGQITVLHSFAGYPSEGAYPIAGVVQAANGTLYGTTERGGSSTLCQTFGGVFGCGTVFKVTPSGTLTTLHSFDTTDGALPNGGLVQAGSSLYGTTSDVATSTFGTVFKITPSGTLTTIYNFCSQAGCADGAYPGSGMVKATDGNLYGTTEQSGSGSAGTVFEITTAGTLTTLHSFDNADGQAPFAGLLQATNGNLYGSTSVGGTNEADGTIFGLSAGLPRFIQSTPTAGTVGTSVMILGNSLTGTTAVTFNGTAATFTVVSATEIKATVPTGATTGPVQATTPHGTLTSNAAFQVR
ncbi:MAG TPA: choice-of-anchor tandem repeat GloVer-containing protein [Terriglobales bacterium]|nr:choice-of-anchor tandem repeat GloVer-containing protein [Terriglobales bacterium]